jgi:hypothetical protein
MALWECLGKVSKGTYNGSSAAIDLHEIFAKTPFATRNHCLPGVSFIYDRRPVLPGAATGKAAVVGDATGRRQGKDPLCRVQGRGRACRALALRNAASGTVKQSADAECRLIPAPQAEDPAPAADASPIAVRAGASPATIPCGGSRSVGLVVRRLANGDGDDVEPLAVDMSPRTEPPPPAVCVTDRRR